MSKNPSLYHESEKESLFLTHLDTMLIKEAGYTNIQTNTDPDPYGYGQLNELKPENLDAILAQYSTLKENKEQFIEKCLKSWNKTLFRSTVVLNIVLFAWLFHNVHQEDIKYYPKGGNGLLITEILLCQIMASMPYIVMACYFIFEHVPKWYKKLWQKNKVNDIELFKNYRLQLYQMFEQKKFQNKYFAYLQLQLAQIEKAIEKSPIFHGKELRRIHHETSQIQTNLINHFAENRAYEIHGDIIKIERLLHEWRKISQQSQHVDSKNHEALSKADDFLKQHQEFMKSSGLDSLLEMIKDPNNPEHMVKTML